MTRHEAGQDGWHAARFRCPCGQTADDAESFGRHLDQTDGSYPEHFEVLDGWSLDEVRQWQACPSAEC